MKTCLVSWIFIFCLCRLCLADAGGSSEEAKIKIMIFASSTCEECEELKEIVLPPLMARYGGLVAYEHVKTDEADGFKKLLAYEKRYNRSSDEAVRAFVGKHALMGLTEIKEMLPSALDEEIDDFYRHSELDVNHKLEARATSDTPSTITLDELAATKFDAFKPGVIAAAGLIDGINPCAFVTLVFFISVLANLKKSPLEIMLVGLAFAFAVFATYLLLGFGILRFVKAFSVSSGIAKGINIGVAAFVLILSAYSFWDYLKCLRGKAKEMSLKLPDGLRMIINRLINTRMRRRHLVLWALALGFLVSLLESMCTGQVYLPTIMYVLKEGRERVTTAFAYLALYNLMFIVPLLVVFVLAFYGVSSKAITGWFNRNLALSKLLMAVLFLTLGMILLAG